MSHEDRMQTGADQGISPRELRTIAVEAYVFGYPLVLLDATRALATSDGRGSGAGAVVNQFIHSRAFPNERFHDVVSANADTLYSTAWIDLTAGPVVLGVPEMQRRYYIMQLLDGWTNVFAAPGTRTTGSDRRDFALVGPGWVGTLPPGLGRIDAPTNLVWLIGRTYTAGRADYPAVHAVQDRYALTPLDRWGWQDPATAARPAGSDPNPPPVAAGVAPADQVAALDAATYFGRLAALMALTPPRSEDRPLLERIARIGIRPGRAFVLDRLDTSTAQIMAQAMQAAREQIARAFDYTETRINGWRMHLETGRYGTDYLRRAAVAHVGLGANLPEDAVYASTNVDEDGRPLDGKRRYLLRFHRNQLPPTNAFWSVTLYDQRHFFVKNAIDRHALGDRNPLRPGQDGSLTLYLQPEAPAGAESANWLPTPATPFNLIMRLYGPRPSVLDGTWKPPAVRRAIGHQSH